MKYAKLLIILTFYLITFSNDYYYPMRPNHYNFRRGYIEDGIYIEMCGIFDENDSIIEGWIVFSYQDGRRREEHYKNRKLNGLMRVFSVDGTQGLIFYKDGEQHGYREYWYSNGLKMQEANYKNGKLDGLVKAWHKNGELESITECENGNFLKEIIWDYNGKINKNKNF